VGETKRQQVLQATAARPRHHICHRATLVAIEPVCLMG